MRLWTVCLFHPRLLPSTGKREENITCAPESLSDCPAEVSFDRFRGACLCFIPTHVEEQQWVIVRGLYQAGEFPGDVLNTGPGEAADFSERRVCPAYRALCTLQMGVPYDYNSPFLLCWGGHDPRHGPFGPRCYLWSSLTVIHTLARVAFPTTAPHPLHQDGKVENAFESEYQKLQEHNESLHELRKECTAKRELFLKTNAQQTIRCKQLLSELSYIYPIDLNDQKDYFVCGVKLPNSEDFQAKDDGSVAVALGYTAHLVSMISYFLQVPLRYPIIHKGSRSTIKDNINDKLTEKEREFPLYPKGGEKLQFEYGVYLLNKNIAQLRYQHGLSTPDLRQTLPNLKNFMELGLMVRCDRHHTSSAIPVPKRQSSSFGRLDIGFSTGLPSPDKGLRKRASTGNERLQYKTPPPSYNSALTQPVAITARVGELDKKPGSISSSLDTSMDSSKGNPKKSEDLCSSLNGENGSLNNTQDRQESFLRHSSAINGAFLPGECSGTASNEQPCEFRPSLGPVLCCTVEQAEEIMGMEATGFSTGDQLEDFNSIPVEHAVAVECDEQVLGEFEEFSRRIYALNENMSSFRRPRKSSDK
nr:PREDICTED: UV radiation resistance-associated gene protein-like [Balearica regulorum gibbericeps]